MVSGLIRSITGEQDLTVSGEAEDVSTALQSITDSRPDIVITDLTFKHGSGLRLIEDLLHRDKELRILVLSMHEEMQYAERCLRAGAKGYVMKNEDTARVVEGIRKIFAGNIYLSKNVTSLMLQKALGDSDDTGRTPVESLADRELEVFQLIGQGYNTQLIAKRLHISPATVRHYKSRIKEKLYLKHSSDLLQYAIRWVVDSDKS